MDQPYPSEIDYSWTDHLEHHHQNQIFAPRLLVHNHRLYLHVWEENETYLYQCPYKTTLGNHEELRPVLQ